MFGRLLGRLLFKTVDSVVNSPSRVGERGERKLEKALSECLPPPDYRQYHNLTLPTPSGTTQIDHLLVSPFGIFVVETKTMSGWIFGSKNNRTWVQTFPNGERLKFQNPLRQNYGHVKAVEKSLSDLRLPKQSVKSVVAFMGDAEIKTEMPQNVGVGIEVIYYIHSFQTRILNNQQIAKACSIIESRRMEASKTTDREHIQNLHQVRNSPNQRKCPRCGSKLKLRTAKKGRNQGGQFWGCEKFPRCRYTQNQ